MGKQQVRIHTFLQEVNLEIDKNTTGNQLVLEITEAIDVKPAMYFSLLYDRKDGQRKFLMLSKAVLDHKIDKRHKPLQLYLRLRIHPMKAAEFKHENTKLVIFRELKQAIETGELCTPSNVAADLHQLAQKERVEDFLKTVEEKVDNYGVTRYNLKRDDGYPVLLCSTLSGVVIRAGTEYHEMPFCKIKHVNRGRKSITISQFAPSPDVKVVASDSSLAKEVQDTIMVNYAIHRQQLSSTL